MSRSPSPVPDDGPVIIHCRDTEEAKALAGDKPFVVVPRGTVIFVVPEVPPPKPKRRMPRRPLVLMDEIIKHPRSGELSRMTQGRLLEIRGLLRRGMGLSDFDPQAHAFAENVWKFLYHGEPAPP